jgi:monoamine oxidase
MGRGPTNVHICGEAFSDFQGFMEGALRSAQHALTKALG